MSLRPSFSGVIFRCQNHIFPPQASICVAKSKPVSTGHHAENATPQGRVFGVVVGRNALFIKIDV